MTLDAIIDGWSDEHINAAENMVNGTAIKNKELFKKMPLDVVVTGDNWYIVFQLTYQESLDIPKNGDYVITGYFHNIERQGGNISRKGYVPLEQVLKYAEDEGLITSDELALIPVTQRTQEDARSLGAISGERDDWYIVQRGDKPIRVFKYTPDYETSRDNSLGVDIIHINREPPIKLN